MKKGINLRTFLVYTSVFCVVVLSTSSYGADYRFEACGPRNCGNGPNVSFPFYIQGVQESYCGYAYPGFILNCSTHGYPVLPLGETEYVIEDIFYETQSFRVHNPAFLNSDNSNCLPRFRNTTLLKPQFDFADNVTDLHLFSNCTGSSSEEMSLCDGSRALALYDGDDSVGNAKENCRTNLVAPVENGDMDMGNLVQVLRKGFVINWKASDCSVCRNSGGHCGFNETAHLFRCFCPDRPHSGSCKPAEKSRKKLILATAISAGGVFLLLSLSISLMIRRCDMSSDTFSKSDMELGSFHFNIPIFSYKELVVATKNFDTSSELGDGGFGTVYYGKLRDGREVAVKRLYERNCRRVEQFMNEINILTNLRHKNLVSLYGCTNKRSKELLLVYEYISNGTVADHLHGERAEKSPLTWPIRMKIAIETASALAYLHKSDIIHRDVKTNNILLDSNFCVKVADFGLSRLFPTDVTHVSTVPQGTPGYVDPDYHQCYQLNSKSDVYSFGVVLIELISSMPAVDINRHNSEINLANLAVNRILRQAFDELIDPSLGYGSDDDTTRTTILVAELAFRCLQLEKDMRPSMDEILGFLKEIQGGDEFDLETRKSGDDDVAGAGRIPASPETDDSVLLKSKKFEASPNAVTDRWISSSSTTSSYHKSVEI